MGSGRHEVVAPDVVGLLGPQPHTASVGEPESSAGPLLLRDLQPFHPPDSARRVLDHRPALELEHHRHHPVAVAPAMVGKPHDRLREQVFVRPHRGHLALRAPAAARAAGRPVTPMPRTCPEHARRLCAAARGLEVSLDHALQDCLVKTQVRHRLLQPLVLSLQILLLLRLVDFQPAKQPALNPTTLNLV